MAVQLQQMHPALVHLPFTLLPLAVGADLLGCLTGNKSLHGFGRTAIELAAVGALGAAVTGLIAGEEVNVKGETQDMLMTHRNLNFVATVVTTSMAVWRARRERPNAVYLGAGFAGVGAWSRHTGVFRTDAPVLRTGQVGAFFETAMSDLLHGVQHMIQEVAKGNLIPTITAWCAKHCGVSKQITTAAPSES